MKDKKIPLRKCISCNERKSKKDLIRLVKKGDKDVIIDKTGKANGRGAYLCLNLECIDDAEKTKKLSRALSTEVSQDIYDELRKLVE